MKAFINEKIKHFPITATTTITKFITAKSIKSALSSSIVLFNSSWAKLHYWVRMDEGF